MTYLSTKVTGAVHPRIDIRVYRTEKPGLLAKSDRLAIYRVDTKDRFFEFIEFNGKKVEPGHPAYFFVSDAAGYYVMSKEDKLVHIISNKYADRSIGAPMSVEELSAQKGPSFSFGIAPGQDSDNDKVAYMTSGPEINFFHNMGLPAALELQQFVIDWTAGNTSYGGWVGEIPDAVTYHKALFHSGD